MEAEIAAVGRPSRRAQRKGRLDGKVALITGSGGGMGRVAAALFAAEGARVVVADLDEAGGRATVESIRQDGGEAIFVAANLAVEVDARHCVEAAVEQFGGLHILYNNAGIMPPEDGAVTEMQEDVWDRVLSVNLKSAALCCKHAIPPMVETGGGSIINVASFVALLGCTVPQDAYTASKGGMIALTKSLAIQHARQGIRANAICPGPIETPLLRQLWTSEAARNLRLARIPLGRFGAAEDIVYLALYLASDEAAWTTGAVMVVDGGITSNYF